MVGIGAVASVDRDHGRVGGNGRAEVGLDGDGVEAFVFGSEAGYAEVGEGASEECHVG